jgi:hypothetical protein
MYRHTRLAALIVTGAALVAGGTIHAAAAAAVPSNAPRTLTFFAFDINNGTTEPGFIPVAGTNPSVFAQGDVLIINDQITTTHKVGDGYPIVGYDSGVCTITRTPEVNAEETLAECDVTAVWKTGATLTLQGVVTFVAQQPQTAVLAVTGGTGAHNGAAGTLHVAFTASHKILKFDLK